MSMRSMKTILACACAVLAVSCAEKNEIAKPAPETRTITLNATSETIASQDKTRTALDKDGLSVVWKKGDLIQLWYLKNDGFYAKAGELAALSQGIGAVGDGRVTNCELIGVLRRVVERWFEYGRCLSGVGEYEFPVFVFYRVEYFGAIGAIA